MNVMTVFGQMLVLFAMIMLGYVMSKKGNLNEEVSAQLSKMVVNIFNPILIVNCVLDREPGDYQNNIYQNLGLVILYFFILMVFSYVMVWMIRPIPTEKPMYVLMTVFSNLGYIGIPVAKSMYGNESAVYVAFYVLGYNIFLYTYGVLVADRISGCQAKASEREKMGTLILASLKKFFNPGVIACIIAAFIFVLNITFPAPILTFCGYMGNATIPLSMLLLGAFFAQVGISDTVKEWRTYAFAILRMIVLPVLVYFLTRNLSIDPVVYGVFILEMAMPVGTVVTILVREKGADTACCMRGTLITTVASVITVPLVCMLTIG